MTTTRFAPSPTGLLHLGHAYSALHAAAHGDRFLLRVEDIDVTRCRPQFEAALLEDLAWLGLIWERPVRRQSEHLDDYRAALDRLEAMGLLYKCFHSRKELDAALSAPHHPPLSGPDGPAVTDTDTLMDAGERARREAAGEAYALRLRMAEAIRQVGSLTWTDRTHGDQAARPEVFGDVVLARKDIATSYHLAVTVDDALQGVTLVTRGDDLFQATHVHRLLQALLDLPVPEWAHHPLLVDPATGRRFAKRDRSLTLRALRASGVTPEEVRARIGFEGVS
jgi:glutamyl-Q tRNA(Asp) synthetase